MQLNLSISPLELPSLIEAIEAKLEEAPLFELPKAYLVQDKVVIKQLDRKLVHAIINYEDPGVNVEEFSISGVNFIFSDWDDHSLYVKGHSKDKEHVGELSIEKLVSFIKSHNIDLNEQLDNIKVQIHNEHGRDRTQPLKSFLDYIDEEDRYCLIDGKWYKFNQSYVNFLQREVDSLELFEYDERFDIDPSIKEDDFNKQRADEDGFYNCDKVLESIGDKYRVEKMDLYKNENLFFVKIGTPQKQSYVIDQAINTVRILQNNQSLIEIEGKEVAVKGICLWMVLDRRTKIENLSEVNSLILHMKLAEWKRIVSDAGFNPLVRINYVVK